MSVFGLILIALVLIMAASIVWSTLKTGISPMPSHRTASKAIGDLMPAQFDGCVYELGSGWGQLAIHLAATYPSAQVIAIELSPLPFLFSKALASVRGVRNVVFLREDFTQTNLSKADVVVCYLYPDAMTRLHEQFKKQLRSGAIIISNTFRLPGWPPTAEVELSDLYRSRIYRYEVGAPFDAPTTEAEALHT